MFFFSLPRLLWASLLHEGDKTAKVTWEVLWCYDVLPPGADYKVKTYICNLTHYLKGIVQLNKNHVSHVNDRQNKKIWHQGHEKSTGGVQVADSQEVFRHQPALWEQKDVKTQEIFPPPSAQRLFSGAEPRQRVRRHGEEGGADHRMLLGNRPQPGCPAGLGPRESIQR